MTTGVHVWSRTASSNATADTSINWAEGQAPSTVNDSARAVMARIAEYRDDIAGTLTTSGTSTAYTLTTNTVFTTLALLSGCKLTVKFDNTNGASPTLNVDGLGAKAIQTVSGTAIPTGFIVAGSIWSVTYNNAIPAFLLHSANTDGRVATGVVSPHAGSSAPSGYLLCDGSSYLRATYAALFAEISTTYGAADGTHFNVPDLTGRTVFGKESSATRILSGSGITSTAVGNTGGASTVALITAELASHSHGVTDPTHAHSYSQDVSGSNGPTGGGGVPGPISTQATGANATGISINNAGSGTAHNNMPPTLIMNWIIKT